MTTLNRIRIASAIGALLFSGALHAVPVKWELENVSFADGATASGSFVVDIDTMTFSGVNITTTFGSAALPGQTYTGDVFTTGYTPGGALQFVRFATSGGDLTGESTFSLFFLTPLTNAGGLSNLFESETAEVSCASFDCNLASAIRFAEAGGRVRAVPGPASLGLIGLGLAGLLIGRRRPAA